MQARWTEQVAVDALIRSLRGEVHYPGPVNEVEIAAAASTLGLQFPSSYRAFLAQYGALEVGPIKIRGLGMPQDSSPSVIQATLMLRATCPDLPVGLIPIEELDNAWSICLRCNLSPSGGTNAEVVRWNLLTGLLDEKPVAVGFWKYLHDRLKEWRHREIGIKTMEGHVQQFDEEYLKVGKVPRNNVWRPYRFCSQDVALGLTVVRHSIDNNCLEVDVCMTSDVPEYEPGSGAKMMASFLLSEAYKCGGTMEIRFSEYVEGGRVPQTLCDLADTYGVTLEHVAEGRITPLEARRLYVAITEFSPVLLDHIEGLARAGKLSQERACYAIHHGLWTRPELENIVLGSARADSILGGDAQPEQRHLYLNDLLHARATVMGGFLDRKLAKRERGDGNEALDLEDDVWPLRISFDATYYAKVYTCSEELQVPWTIGQQPRFSSLSAGSQLIVLLRARDVDDLTLRFEEDLGLAAELAKLLGTQIESNPVYILVPRDFEDLPLDLREHFAYVAQTKGVGIMICPETIVSMDTDAARRLASSRIMRE